MNWKKNWIVKKSGGVVRDGEKFFVVKRNNYNDISLPKWHIEQWESTENAALREVLEETWLDCQIVWDLWTTEYLNFEWIVQVQYFAMRVKEKTTNKLFSDIDEVITWNYDRIQKLLSYATDKKILEKWAKFFELNIW
jgi:ADP-ribose pyrophosphatase YjhB (NUDIX family)